jgi:hypothetical protein
MIPKREAKTNYWSETMPRFQLGQKGKDLSHSLAEKLPPSNKNVPLWIRNIVLAIGELHFDT